jgi:hypothetical protein
MPLIEGYQGGALFAWTTDEQNGVRAVFQSSTAALPQLFLGTQTSGTWTWGTASSKQNDLKNYSNTFYLHLQRNDSNIWWGWVNFTGGKNTWFECGSMTKSVSIEKIVVSCGMGTASGQNAFAGSPGGIDWIRKDWITL